MLLRVMGLCLSLFLLVSCEKKITPSEQTPLIVITSPDSPPFEFKDTANGGDKVIGFDIDVIQKLGEYLGRPIKIVEADFYSLIPSLQSGRADMAIAYITPTNERRKTIDFSDPYYISRKALLVLEASEITSERDLRGEKLGTQLGSANEALAQKWTKEIAELHIVSLNKIGDLIQELKIGRIQAILLEDIVARKIIASTPGLKIIVLMDTEDPLAIAFPKGSPLVGPTNEALKKMDDDIKDIESKWIHE